MMSRLVLYILCVLCLFNFTRCSSQSIPTKENNTTQDGILLYYMHEPYFFSTFDTSIEKVSRANIIGLKLGKIDLKDIYDSLSHKHDVIIYAAGDRNKIDTVKSKVGILKVRMKTQPTKTMHSADTSAFSFVYGKDEWVFRYEIRYDKEVLSITPILPSDIKALKSFINRIKNQ